MVPTGAGTCIDRVEWQRPNGKPLISASALPELEEGAPDLSADTLCRSVGKRTCERAEWVSACSAGERFPYGDKYEPGKCNDDKPWKTIDEARVAHRDPKELARLDGSEPPGAYRECKSPSGAVDMVGNVEEWVRCPEGAFGWCLVGGYWASRGLRSCKSAITVHAPRWHYAATGLRCCAEMKRSE
jgi:formylglycine-generating enzyme required for sulfatase activity